MSESARGRTADTYEAALSQIAPNASRLKRGYNRNLGRALLAAVNLHLLLLAGYWIATYATATPAPENEGEVVIKGIYVDPPLENAPDEPVTGGLPPSGPDAGTPTPVPDVLAEPDATVETQEQLAEPGLGDAGQPSTDRDGTGETGGAPNLLVPPVVQDPVEPTSEPPTRIEETVETPPAAEVLSFSEVSPELIGGMGAFQAGIEYPEFERRVGTSGRVIVRFVVDEAGLPSQIEVVRSVSPGLDRAAVRAVEGARFTPGRQNGRAVKVRFTLPVSFRIQ